MRPKAPSSLDMFDSCGCLPVTSKTKRSLKRRKATFSDFPFKLAKQNDNWTNRCTLSLSTPCTSSISNCPPSKVLPFLYLGSEEDAQSEDLLRTCKVKYVLNASLTAADTPHCTSGYYLRIPISDSLNENITEWFQIAFDFIDKVKESDDNLLLHCVGGVSRSAAFAIAYVMKHLSLSLDNAYRYVKNKRPTISPNLNFMGQLMQYEEILQQKKNLLYSPLSEVGMESLNISTNDQSLVSTPTSPNVVIEVTSFTGTATDGFYFLNQNELNKKCDYASKIDNNYTFTEISVLE
ncbi:dual specificity protein phosphatase 16 [Hydra vulgaris]|uniref:dual specificity protein phosphatase 16 n=1 Tax=Hydra vulgaris TaxID=6087 RepID=UPI000640DC32|nr:dual specificity protein phosphatase 16 [Hydra vulgaris]